MSKFLLQTKSFLPMVIQKSGTETIKVLDKQSLVPTSELLKDDAITITPPSDINLQTDEQFNMDLKVIIQKNLKESKVITVPHNDVFKEPRKLSDALAMDVLLVQQWMVVRLASVHMRIFGEPRAVVRSIPSSSASASSTSLAQAPLVWIESTSQGQRVKVSEEKPVTIVPKTGKESKSVPPPETSSSPPPPQLPTPGSNLVEAFVERTPVWQNTISTHLGNLHRKFVDKLP